MCCSQNTQQLRINGNVHGQKSPSLTFYYIRPRRLYLFTGNAVLRRRCLREMRLSRRSCDRQALLRTAHLYVFITLRFVISYIVATLQQQYSATYQVHHHASLHLPKHPLQEGSIAPTYALRTLLSKKKCRTHRPNSAPSE